MDEIPSLFTSAGLQGGFHLAAAEVYRRLAHFKNTSATPPLDEIVAALLDQRDAELE